MPTRQRISQLIAWCMYDWASSSFSIIVTTFVFSTYFAMNIAENKIVGTYQWGNATAIAGIVIAFFSPLFGAIADYGGHHRAWLIFFSTISILSTACLWFAYPTPASTYFMLTCVVLATVAFELALVFYNSFLPYIVSKEYMGRISGIGWGAGGIGGIIALTIVLFLFLKTNLFSLDIASSAEIRICGPFVAMWYAIFALPLFFLAPTITCASCSFPKAVRLGFRELLSTLKKLPQEKNIFLYLVSHMIYADGLNTLFALGGIYAASIYGFNFEEVLLLGITMNVTAGIGAIALGWVDDYLGSKFTVITSLILMTLLAFPMLFLSNKYIFWMLALLLSIFIGPVQSASRSLMIRLILTKNNSTEMLGLYSLSGKITAFIGPWLFGVMTLTFATQRAGMTTVLLFFIIGAILLLYVKEDRTRNLLSDNG